MVHILDRDLSPSEIIERQKTVAEWKVNATATIRRLWAEGEEKGIIGDDCQDEEIETVLSYVEGRCITEMLTDDWVITDKDGKPNIDEGLVWEAFEVWQYSGPDWSPAFCKAKKAFRKMRAQVYEKLNLSDDPADPACKRNGYAFDHAAWTGAFEAQDFPHLITLDYLVMTTKRYVEDKAFRMELLPPDIS